MSVAQPMATVWKLACDRAAWPPMSGAQLVIELRSIVAFHRLGYGITSGLPVREHRGELVLAETPTGGTELVFTESFRPRIWGTGGYLRGRRERALIDAGLRWGGISADSTPTAT